MQMVHKLAVAAFLTLAVSTPALSQVAPPAARSVSLAGPRFGGTFLSDGVVSALAKQDHIAIRPVMTQFGWQFEKQFYSTPNGPIGVTEAVVLLGGLEQGYALPSLSWLAG